eukprot:gb/GEZJ01011012.1/.p1 GENE.gb/GEZJ01011012.1/~~gb/GEZJ01011012.1/.p1  ORF type:complete len:123 (-),score=7.36 gb/GEZJ01011012.1/:48-416(-)
MQCARYCAIQSYRCVNRSALKVDIERLKHALCGEWRLFQMFYKGNEPKNTLQLADKAGFVVLKDFSVMAFYTNDLADTPTSRIHTPDEYAMHCIHGLRSLQRGIDEESGRSTILQVPSIILA